MTLTNPQYRLLKLLEKEAVDIQNAARRLETTAAGVSNVRCKLRDLGLIKDWKLWQEPMQITNAGRDLIRPS